MKNFRGKLSPVDGEGIMQKISVGEIINATKGILVSGKKDQIFTNLSTDTRIISTGDMFVPLSGQNFDGHDFLLNKGI